MKHVQEFVTYGTTLICIISPLSEYCAAHKIKMTLYLNHSEPPGERDSIFICIDFSPPSLSELECPKFFSSNGGIAQR